MIEVNLIAGKKPFKMPVILGIDLSFVNFKALLIVWLLSLGVDYFVGSYSEEQQEIKKQKTDQLRTHARKLQVQARELKNAEEKADELKAKQEILQRKLVIVKELLKEKINPMKILMYISENIPQSVWLENLNFENKTMILKGFSKSYKGIGIFLDNLKKGIFFEQPIELTESKTIIDNDTNVRKEQFTIKMRIKEF